MTELHVKATPSRWVKVAVDYYRNPKIIAVGVFSEIAYVRLLAMARERVEIAERNGEVPYLLACRELRDIVDASDFADTDALLAPLLESGLISQEGDALLIDDYEKWQTTREEIAATRESARLRAAHSREQRKQKGTTSATTSRATKAR